MLRPIPVKKKNAVTLKKIVITVLVVHAGLVLLLGVLAVVAPGSSRADVTFISAPVTAQSKIIHKEDVVYGRVHGAGLLADLAYPESVKPLPVILSVHGGRWFRGTKTEGSAIKVKEWAGYGFFAMSIDYRLVGGTPAPACYQDVFCAIRWIHAHADKYSLDVSRIYLIGHSAGGHMVSLAATLGEGYERTGGWEEASCDFRAVICVAGPSRLNELSWGTYWAPPDQDPKEAREYASPFNHVSAKMKPMLVLHSDDDKSVPVKQALDMVQKMKEKKAPHRFVHYRDKGHLGISTDVVREARAFIERLEAGDLDLFE